MDLVVVVVVVLFLLLPLLQLMPLPRHPLAPVKSRMVYLSVAGLPKVVLEKGR